MESLPEEAVRVELQDLGGSGNWIAHLLFGLTWIQHESVASKIVVPITLATLSSPY